MVGLSIVLEAQKGGATTATTATFSSPSGSGFSKKNPQVINKATMTINKPYSASSSSFPTSSFLQQCFLCGQKLLPGKDIYMYKGDRGFCSVECRYRQIYMDEEETVKKENCSLATMKPTSASSSPPCSSSSSASRHRKNGRNRAGGFAY